MPSVRAAAIIGSLGRPTCAAHANDRLAVLLRRSVDPAGDLADCAVEHDRVSVARRTLSPSAACPYRCRARRDLTVAGASRPLYDGSSPTTVATKIKLMRLGKMRAPYYRVVVADARTKRDGRVIETVGKYHPKEDPSFIEIDSERVQYWLGVGAQPTDPVAAILKVTGDWQRFKGLPAPEPMKVAVPKADKREVFQAAARAAAGVEDRAATTPKRSKKPADVASGGEQQTVAPTTVGE